MTIYMLDSNVLIQAKQGPYDLEVFPVFWDWLDGRFSDEKIAGCEFVYQEILDGEDELSEWLKDRKKYFLGVNDNTQTIYSEIVDYTFQNYEEAHANHFVSKADPWIIAQAKDLNATIVTQEKLVPSDAKKVKIPNVCDVFDVRYIHTYELLKELGAKFAS